MLSYNVLKSNGKPNWGKVGKALINQLEWTEHTDITAYAQLTYGADCLYVHLHADEKYIRAEGFGTLDEPYLDSCLEFFFSPSNGDSRYINIEMNPNCCIYFGIGTGNDNLIRIILPQGADSLNAECRKTPGSWDLYYELPFSLIRLFFPDFAPEGHLRANFYKCGDLTKQEHYLSWNRVECEKPDFHRPEYFGELIFSVEETERA